jgi:hypothetical protein
VLALEEARFLASLYLKTLKGWGPTKPTVFNSFLPNGIAVRWAGSISFLFYKAFYDFPLEDLCC